MTIEEQIHCSDQPNNSIKFDYILNEKTAKNKILKGARTTVLEIQENTGSSNLVFSAGAWKVAVLPAIEY